MRLIISQKPAVTYKIAKALLELITPYTPSQYSLKSTDEFLDIMRAASPSPLMASMDVESLFTNVPVQETIELICKRIYHSDETPLTIPEDTLRSLLQICTMEAPFYGPDNNMYVQHDGVAMGSPLGPLFANFYMGSIEEKIFNEHPELKPKIYTRYVDDIFLNTTDENSVAQIVTTFKDNSALNFTHEIEEDNKIAFLDTAIHRNTNSFSTEVYVKETNLGFCLNGNSECPQKYKLSVINSFVRRALTHCSTWRATNQELNRVSQLLVNNGYAKKDIDDVIKRRLDKFMEPPPPQDTPPTITLFYKNTMTTAHKTDEKILQNIIYKNIKPVNEEAKLKLIIYYKSRRTSNLIMKNSCLPIKAPTEETNVIYQFKCNFGNCSSLDSRYIGETTTTLRRRLYAHIRNGSIKQHVHNEHGITLTQEQIEENTSILHRESDKRRLILTEALYIHTTKPSMNIQQTPENILPSLRNNRTH